MNKKILITGIGILVFVGLLWFAYDNINESRKQVGITDVSDSQVQEERSGGAEPQESPEVENVGPDLEEEERARLQTLAMTIINRPIMFSISMTPESQTQAQESIESLSGLITENFDTNVAWLDLGAYRRLIGDYEGAIEAWEFLETIRPRSHIATHNLADLYAFTLRDFHKAEEYFRKAIRINKSSAESYIGLSTLYRNVTETFNREDKVDDVLLEGIAAIPTNFNLATILAMYYQETGNTAGAIKYFEEAVRRDHPNATAIQAEIAQLRASQS